MRMMGALCSRCISLYSHHNSILAQLGFDIRIKLCFSYSSSSYQGLKFYHQYVFLMYMKVHFMHKKETERLIWL